MAIARRLSLLLGLAVAVCGAALGQCGSSDTLTCNGFSCDGNAGQIYCIHPAAPCPRCFPQLAPGKCPQGMTSVTSGSCAAPGLGCEQPIEAAAPSCADQIPASCAPACGTSCKGDVTCAAPVCS